MQPGFDPRVVSLSTGKTIRTLDGHKRWATCAAFSPDGKLLATASGTTEDAYARVYTTRYPPRDAVTEIILRDASSGRVIATLRDKDKAHDFAWLGFSPDGKYLFAVTRDKEVTLWGRLPPIPAKADPLTKFVGFGEKKKVAAPKKRAVPRRQEP
jgi:WD40 repeat protein